MAPSLRPEYLARYRELAGLLLKYGRGDLVRGAGLDDNLAREPDAVPAGEASSGALAEDLERLGPTYVKLGQLLSTRSDLLPPDLLSGLDRLQDSVSPFSFAEVERIVESELGVRLSRAFATFDATPLAAASLGQVHRAQLRNGRDVVVKVQRPQIRERIAADLDALAEVAEFADQHTDLGKQMRFGAMLEEFRRSLVRELDYRLEAQNLVRLGANLARFERIVVPQPVEDFTTARVLTMDHVAGRKITKLSPLARLELDGRGLARELFDAYLHQILIDGFFHADPHPGNVFLTDDRRIALIDLGMVAHLSSRLQENLLQLLLAISEGRADEAVAYARRLGEKTDQFAEADFTRRTTGLVAEMQGANLRQIEAGRVVLDVARTAAATGLRMPPELSLLAKTLLNLDQVGWTLDPGFDPNLALRESAAVMMRERVEKSLRPGNLFSSALEMKDFVERLPARVNRILDAMAGNDLEIKVHAIDEDRLMAGFQKVANRITTGLVLSALIVGAALIMRVDTPAKILGYPALAIVFFLIAAIGAFWLVASIIRDE